MSRNESHLCIFTVNQKAFGFKQNHLSLSKYIEFHEIKTNSKQKSTGSYSNLN